MMSFSIQVSMFSIIVVFKMLHSSLSKLESRVKGRQQKFSLLVLQ